MDETRPHVRHTRGRLAVAGVALLLAGCTGGVTLTVDLRTDLAPLTEITGVRTTLDATEVDHLPSPGEAWPTGWHVAEFSGVKRGVHDVVVSLYAGARLVAQRRVAVTLTTDYVVTVVITHSCADVTCPRAGDPAGSTTCVNGLCASPTCGSPGEPACPTCTADAMCPPARVACATAACVVGACLDTPHDERCASGQTCDLATGCAAGPPRLDAGTHDAGPGVDAGTHRDAGTHDGGPVTCSPDCGGRECGADPVCGQSCGDCTGGATCNGSGRCACGAGQGYCGGACVELSNDAANCGACGVSCSGGTCSGGACACPGALTACSTGCADLRVDSGHCGSCGNSCNIFSGPACCGGGCTFLTIDASNCGSCGHVCGGVAPACCGLVCADTDSDAANCGHCGGACDPGRTCVSGGCV